LNWNDVKTRIKALWIGYNRCYKIHLSSGDTNKHEDYIRLNDYKEAISIFDGADVILECKQKDLAIFKLIDELNKK
jgi:UV DNA damage repair endonuclease